MIDPNTMSVCPASPQDVLSWPETVRITSVTLEDSSASKGVKIESTPIPDTWNYHMPGWGTPGVDPGNILFTVWPVVRVSGLWQTGGIIQMWRGRDWTGAPLLKQWSDWAYSRGRHGALVDYAPQVGDEIGFFISAGNARDEKGPTSVRERSNIVSLTLAANTTKLYDNGAVVITLPPPSAPEPPTSPTTDAPNAMVLAALADIKAELDKVFALLDPSLHPPQPPQPPPFVIPVKFPTYTTTIFGSKVVLKPDA